MDRFALAAAVCLWSLAAHADSPARVAPKSIAVKGTFSGKDFSFVCANPPKEPGGPSRARRVGTSMAAIKCTDEASRFEANLTVKLEAAKHTLPPDESTGFMAFAAPIAGSKQEVIASTGAGTPGVTGTSEVTQWDEVSGHLVGRAVLGWGKDKTGKAGSVTMAFDLTLPP